MLDHAMVCSVSTIAHVPCSVRPLLARVLSVELRKVCSSVLGFHPFSYVYQSSFAFPVRTNIAVV